MPGQASPVLSAFTKFLREAISPTPSEEDCVQLATALQTLGFAHWRDLHGADSTAVGRELQLDESALVLLHGAITRANRDHDVPNVNLHVGGSSSNAIAVATRLSEHVPGGTARCLHQQFRERWSLQNLGATTPRASIILLQQAIDNGLSVEDLQHYEGFAVLADAAPKSLPQICSGLRCWHAFAVGVLQMSENHTLPPRSDNDVVLYVCIFRNGGTCKNYISALRFGCRISQQSMVWDTDRVSQAVRGVVSRTMLAAKPRKRIGRALLRKLVHHALAEGAVEEAEVYCFAFVYLLRVENECLPLEGGVAQDSEAYTSELPANRHSAVWCETAELVIRLRSRKNKRSGSTLRRGCTCQQETAADLCPVHRLARRVCGLSTGQKLFPATCAAGGQRLRDSLRRRLVLLGIPEAHAYGLQSFRRGAAQQILDDGGSLADILKAGQWSSSAFNLYLDMAEIEATAVVDALTGAHDGADDTQ